jgi:hypothetical protein
MKKIISEAAVSRRAYWVEEIRKISGNFGVDSARLHKELTGEIKSGGSAIILDHLRLCGDIPESYEHDSSEEKLYSKYTDQLLSQAYRCLGMNSLVLTERADAADVEAFGGGFSLVADAKAFRLSRTAKNQKDFKVQAMDGWRRDKPYAMVVCPIYQLPTRSSQIYEQATARNVCLFTYSHLAVLVSLAMLDGKPSAEALLKTILESVPAMNPSKDASAYWLGINRVMLSWSSKILGLWSNEKQAAVESIAAAKEEALLYLANERTKIMKLSHEDALLELVRAHNIENRMDVIRRLSDSKILDLV